MNIDWSQAPAWAQYHVFDKDTVGFWFEKKPFVGGIVWWPSRATDCARSGYALPAGQDWRQSLVERPKP